MKKQILEKRGSIPGWARLLLRDPSSLGIVLGGAKGEGRRSSFRLTRHKALLKAFRRRIARTGKMTENFFFEKKLTTEKRKN